MESHPKEQGQQQQLRRPPLRRSLGGGIPILFLLYMLQGIPFGLVTGSLPVLLSGGATPAGTPPTHRSSSGGGDYRASSYISVASLPYGLKLLAAPVVDTVYSSNLGRRRSWILPVNVVCGLLWWELSSVIDSLVMDAKEPPQKPNGKDGAVEGTLGRDIAGGSSAIEEVQLRRSSALWRLTARLFLVVSVTAVGDVATDGWALTVRHSLLPAASLAQTLGMTVGNFLTNAGVLCGQTRACHELVYRRSTPVQVSFFGLIAVGMHCLVTALVLFCTSEEDSHRQQNTSSQDHPRKNDYQQRGKDAESGGVVAVIGSGEDMANEQQDYGDGESGEDQKQQRPPHEHPYSSAPSPPAWERATCLVSRLWCLGRDRRHCRTLLLLLLTSRFAFALTESGTLPSLEFVRAGGDIGQLALVIALQYPFQALLGLMLARRLSPPPHSAPSSKPASSSSSSLSSSVGTLLAAQQKTHPKKEDGDLHLRVENQELQPQEGEDEVKGQHPLLVWRQTHVVLLSLAVATPVMTAAVAALVSSSSSASSSSSLESPSPSFSSFFAAGGSSITTAIPPRRTNTNGIDDTTTTTVRVWLGTLLLGLVIALSNTANKAFFIAQGTWFNQITSVNNDTAGGTIITLLNALSNCGRFFPRPPAFWLASTPFLGGPLFTSLALALLGVAQLPAVAAALGELRRTTPEDWRLPPPPPPPPRQRRG